MITKQAVANVKALTGEDEPEGAFEAIVSVFGNVDSYGDVVMPGAFADSLAAWGLKSAPIPTIWSHQWADPFAHIGHVMVAAETEVGLRVKSYLDLENPTAVQVHKLLKDERITQFSFGFDVIDAGWGTRKAADGSEREVFELRKLDLLEVGPCLMGVNRETELLSIKGLPPSQRETSDSQRRSSEKGSAAPQLYRAKRLLAWTDLQELQELS